MHERRDRPVLRAVVHERRVVAPDELRQVCRGENELGTEKAHGVVDTPGRRLWRMPPHSARDRVHGNRVSRFPEADPEFRLPSRRER